MSQSKMIDSFFLCETSATEKNHENMKINKKCSLWWINNSSFSPIQILLLIIENTHLYS